MNSLGMPKDVPSARSLCGMIRSISVSVVLTLILVLCSRTGLAADVPGPPTTPEVNAAQASADAALEAGEYEKAYRMYMENLAPNGDKYAQHMIGMMNLHGLGVPTNIPLGAAWLELAADRGDASLEAGRDNVISQLTDEEPQRMQSLLDEIRGRYGGCAMVARLLTQDEQDLTVLTGSRVKAMGSQAITTLYRDQLSDDEVDQVILRRLIDMRERYLRKHCG